MKKESGSIAKQAERLILRRYRDAAGLSPQQLARRQQGLHFRAFEGGRNVLNVGMLITLAKACGVRPGRCRTPLRTRRKKRRHDEGPFSGPASYGTLDRSDKPH